VSHHFCDRFAGSGQVAQCRSDGGAFGFVVQRDRLPEQLFLAAERGVQAWELMPIAAVRSLMAAAS
jgi:hypothetical protein